MYEDNKEQTRIMFDEAYVKARELPDHEPLSWEMLSREVFNLEVPDQASIFEWHHYVSMRNRFKVEINNRCATLGDNWRLYVLSTGESLVKSENKEMVDREIGKRIKRSAQSFALFRKRLSPMLAADGLSRQDRKRIRQMINLGDAAAIAMAGQVRSLTGISKEEKGQIIDVLISYSGEEDMTGGKNADK